MEKQDKIISEREKKTIKQLFSEEGTIEEKLKSLDVISQELLRDVIFWNGIIEIYLEKNELKDKQQEISIQLFKALINNFKPRVVEEERKEKLELAEKFKNITGVDVSMYCFKIDNIDD